MRLDCWFYLLVGYNQRIAFINLHVKFKATRPRVALITKMAQKGPVFVVGLSVSYQMAFFDESLIVKFAAKLSFACICP